MKPVQFISLLAAASLLILLTNCKSSAPPTESNISNASQPASPPKSSYQAFLPNSNLTPGDTLEVTKADICQPGYSSKVRDVPEAVKKKAYEEYGIATHQPHEYEVDHLISLELGGSNSLKNLWPQSYETSPWNAHVKDRLENHLHKLVCDGQLDLKTAQQEIATDWVAAYRKYLGEPGQ